MQVIYDQSTIIPEPCVATIGFFDGVHAGHRYLIRQVQELAEKKGIKSALVTFPMHPRKIMNADYHQDLLTTTDEKIGLLADTGVDYCFMQEFTLKLSQLTAQEFMRSVLKERFQVRCLVIGYDHRFGHNRREGFEDYVRFGEAIGIEVVRAHALTEESEQGTPQNVPVSSSLIRQLLHKGDIEVANRCLDYDYFLEGKVVNGHKIGRTLGFPTANVQPGSPEKLIPADGVYAVWVTVDGKKLMGMLCIGVRPTFDNGSNRTIEVNILHFNSDIYRQKIRLTFVKKMRPDLKFDKVDELVTQLQKDAVEAEAILRADINNSL